MSDLDKFKRRMIRSVARMLLHENRPEDELWEELRKESGCDCKLLWQRMRALTIKKLDRLLSADDKPEQVAAVARLTPTDWLLCDLILVHEEVDLIGRDTLCRKRDPEPLVTLFDLVCSHDIEVIGQKLQWSPNPDTARELAEAWTAATEEYNARPNSGHRCHCSAMLMQKRWYQLKKACRDTFYKLWASYRGNPRLWEKTLEIRPTKLQASIAHRFPKVVTNPFMDWQAQINAGLIILPKEYDDMQKSYRADGSEDTEAQADNDDLVVLEPQIETIELGDSDSEEPGPSDRPGGTPCHDDEEPGPSNRPCGTHFHDFEDSNTEPRPSRHLSETADEPYEDSNPNSNEYSQNYVDMDNVVPMDGLSNVKILEATHVPDEDIAHIDPAVKIKSEIVIKEEPEDLSHPAVKRQKLSLAMNEYLQSTTTTSLDTSDEVHTNDDLIREKINQYLNKSTGRQVSKANTPTFSQVTQPTMDEEDISDINDELIRSIQVSQLEVSTVSSDNVTDDDDRLLITAEVIRQRADAFIKKRIQQAFKDDSSESADDLLQQKTDAFLKKSKTSNSLKSKKTSTTVPIEDYGAQTESHISTDDLIKAKADAYLKKWPVKSKEKLSDINKRSQDTPDDLIKAKAEEYLRRTRHHKEKQSEEDFDDIIKKKAEEFVRHSDLKKLVLNVKTECESETADVKAQCGNETSQHLSEGMEIIDDGIEYFDDDEDDIIKLNIGFQNHGVQESEAQAQHMEEEAPAALDLKLAMDPVVYTLKLDLMSAFNHKTFLHVDDKATIDKALAESKPVRKKALKDLKNDAFDEENRVTKENSFPNNTDKSSNVIEVDKSNTSGVNLDNLDIVKCVEDKMNEFLAKKYTSKRFVGPKSMNRNNGAEFDTSSDNNDDGIPDEMKVKSTSYLLRKPRHRSYNPILLCKNPDFNTRLRRLTVGFFASHDNRTLIKQLKPMTIDLSKAFESKLVDGTLYLKSEDGAKPHETKADHENVQTATVMPSAVSIQSLINNSIQNYIKPVTEPPVHTVDLTGRDKRINLKDINEIRQINQKLQTAQVTPIRMAVDDSLNKPHKTPEQPQSVEQTNKGPVNVVPELQADNNTHIPTTVTVRNMNDDEAQLTSKEARLDSQEFTTAKQKPVGKRYYKPVHLENVVFGHTQNLNVHVPWNQLKPKTVNTELDEFLITEDTLSKMIGKVKGFDEILPPKKKGKNWKYYPREKERREEKKRAEAELKAKQEEAMRNESANDTAKGDEATYVTETDDILNDEIPRNNKARKYCCWAKEKAMKRLTKSKILQKHVCKGICECCCRELLLSKAIRKPETITKPSLCAEETMSKERQVLIDKQKQLENACQSIEAVIQKSSTISQLPIYALPQPRTPIFRVLSGERKDTCTDTETLPQVTTSTRLIPARGQPLDVIYVNDKPDSTSYTYKCVTSRATSTRIVVMEPPEHYFIRHNIVIRVNKSVQTDDLALGDSPILANTAPLKAHTSIALPQVPAATISIPPVLEISPMFTPSLPATHVVYQNPRPLVRGMTTHQNKIVIDGSQLETSPHLSINPKILRPIEMHTDENSKMVYLSSKTISKEPTGLPIYLGKNKILLTTVKFPLNLGKTGATTSTDHSSTTVDAPLNDSESQVNVMPEVRLPPGVQLAMAPNGELTYLVDPGIVLDAQELENLAQIISSVKDKMDASQVTSGTHGQAIVTESCISNNITEVPPEPLIVGESTCQANEIQTDMEASVDPTIEIEQELPVTIIQNNNDIAGQVSQNPSISSENQKYPEDTIGMDQERQNEPIVSLKPKESEGQTMNEESPEQPKDPEAKTIEIDQEQNETITIETQQNTEVETIDVDQDTRKDSEEVTIIDDEQKSAGKSDRGNLLMDLMAMSGISAEDVKVEEPSPTKVFPVQALSSPTKAYLPDSQSNLQELSPVTSLVELKYACEHNGKFFKLDFVTGALVSINVCIKKTKVKKPSVSTPKESVIDLTDDSSERKERKKDPDFNYRLASPVASNVRNLRKTRMRKSSPVILKQLQTPVLEEQTQSTLPVKRKRGRPRKQDLKRIEAKIDLVDSDDPIVEDYLIESDLEDVITSPLNDPVKRLDYYKKSIKVVKKNHQLPESSSRSLLKPVVSANKHDGEESSDDEPLASKAKKIHVRDSVSTENENNANLEGDQEMEHEESDRSPEYPEPTEYDPAEDMAMDIEEENTFEPTILENDNGGPDDDDAEGDCILGV